MSIGHGLNYEKLIRRYKNGRIPVGIWFVSSLGSVGVCVLENLYFHDQALQGIVPSFLWTLLATTPLFIIQAHFVGRQLQRKPDRAFQLMMFIVVAVWLIYACIYGYLVLSFPFQTDLRKAKALVGFMGVMLPWIVLSVVTFRRNIR